jgi:hypothetical protein
MAVPKSDVDVSTAIAVRGLDRNGVAIRFETKASVVARKQAHTAAVNSRECTPNIMVKGRMNWILHEEKDMMEVEVQR